MRPGDRVASRDPATGRLVAATVDRTHTHARVPTIRLTTTSGTVTTTATHPVHVAGRGYVPAGSLRAGDTLTTPDHAPVHVVSVQATGHTTTVHNLTIRHTHNYHVHTTTKQAILVHNNGACDPPEPSGATSGMTREELLDEARRRRDELAMSVDPKDVATVTAGYTLDGRIAVGRSGGALNSPNGGPCAEQDVVRILGVDPSEVHFTEAVRPRRVQNRAKGRPDPRGDEIDICVGCQARYSKDQFPENVKFDKGGAWSE